MPKRDREFQARMFGRTGLMVGPLGFGGDQGAPAAALEEAFERGCNYFWWGSLRRKGMAKAIRNLTARGLRDKLVVAIQTDPHTPRGAITSFYRALRELRQDYADVWTIAMYEADWGEAVLERALKAQAQGAVRHIGVTSHRRSLFGELRNDTRIDVFHIRYNAAHRGAETDAFASLNAKAPQGIAIYNATRQADLIDPRYIPAGERIPEAADCYRFALSNPAVNVVTAGAVSAAEVRAALDTLARGPMDADELAWMRRVGDAVRAGID
jgi:aryl-alcohol dehydrogenase-like predicted oxidoreductase